MTALASQVDSSASEKFQQHFFEVNDRRHKYVGMHYFSSRHQVQMLHTWCWCCLQFINCPLALAQLLPFERGRSISKQIALHSSTSQVSTSLDPARWKQHIACLTGMYVMPLSLVTASPPCCPLLQGRYLSRLIVSLQANSQRLRLC